MTNGRIRAASFLEVVIGLFLLTIVFVSICTLVVRAFAVQAKTNQVIKTSLSLEVYQTLPIMVQMVLVTLSLRQLVQVQLEMRIK